MLEIGQATFERDVVEASREVPVLVDFWAPWCGPCRTLGPLLERIERDYEGRFKLVKINSDENPELAASFRIRSIPYVVAYFDGNPVDVFVGVLPEPQLKQFIDRLLPNPAQIEHRKALRLLDEGRLADAAASLREAIALDPQNDAAQLDLADLLLERLPPPADPARLAEAQDALAAAAPRMRAEPRWVALDTRLKALRLADEGPRPDELRSRVRSDPSDLQARLELSQCHIARREFEPALEQLIEIVERDRAFGDDAGRRTMLSVFELAAHQPALISAYRRRLAAALNR
jgi:putative thioredoxin